MFLHVSLDPSTLYRLIKSAKITMAGNRRLKIYGRLNCAGGKRMRQQNWVFFCTEIEAMKAGYRPCGNCMRHEFLDWKSSKMG